MAVIGLTTFVYVLQLLLGPAAAVGPDNPVFRSLATWTPFIQHFQWWRLGTNALLHQSGWHLWGNMWPVYVFGGGDRSGRGG